MARRFCSSRVLEFPPLLLSLIFIILPGSNEVLANPTPPHVLVTPQLPLLFEENCAKR